MWVVAHKDRVWFFVWKDMWKNKYVLYRYWNISNDTINSLSVLFSNKYGNIDIRVEKIESKFIFINSSSELILDDFLMYPPKYSVWNNYLYGPYLDNIISSYVIQKIATLDIEIYQSIDEEALLRYSCFPKKSTTLVLDTIWQDYISEPLDMQKIYNVKSTRFSKNLITINDPEIIEIDLDMPFRLECDFIESKDIIYLLCPITEWHCTKSSLDIETLEKFEKTIIQVIKSYESNNK